MKPPGRVHALVVGPFESNTYVVSDGGQALVVDPGAEAGRTRAWVDAHRLKVQAIVLTHGHLDHVGAVAELERAWDVDSYLHPADRFLLDLLPETCARYGIEPPYERPARVRELRSGAVFRAGAAGLTVAETPGHSPGGVVLVGPGFALTGDLIFAGSVGRTDLPGSDPRQLLDSIERAVLVLPGTTVLYPGHGPATTVDSERRGNPFLAPGARP
ncbi:MAG TPA: MBL fold metallo-hydrolase [Candidatus Saccharimonadales bacterium]|nr:MBL fold metallo-hydrolase [Candidatus Saccharimonadales bacterium]